MPSTRLLALLSSVVGMRVHAENPKALPTPFPAARYQQMSAKSPFAVASATSVATAAPTPGFAAQLYVDGVAHVGNTDYVAIKSRDAGKPLAIFLAVGTAGEDGMKVERVQWSDQMGKTKVDVSKGGEKATLEFDEAQMAKGMVAVAQPAFSQFARPGVRRLRRNWPGFQPPAQQPPIPGQPQQIVPGADGRDDIQ